MSENEFDPSDFPEESLKIPAELQILTDPKIEEKLKEDSASGEEGGEIKESSGYNLFIAPNRIATRIRQIKHEIFDPETKPGIEHREELLAEYQTLKQQRETIRERMLDRFRKNQENMDDFIARRQKAVRDLEKLYENAHAAGDKEKAKKYLKNWQEHNDYLFLLQNDPSDISLEEEDEGLALK